MESGNRRMIRWLGNLLSIFCFFSNVSAIRSRWLHKINKFISTVPKFQNTCITHLTKVEWRDAYSLNACNRKYFLCSVTGNFLSICLAALLTALIMPWVMVRVRKMLKSRSYRSCYLIRLPKTGLCMSLISSVRKIVVSSYTGDSKLKHSFKNGNQGKIRLNIDFCFWNALNPLH